jgi:branched-chain amino acid transport system permease protein
VATHLQFLLLGLGSGAVIAALALGVVVTHRASHVVNFAHGAIGTYLAFAYYEFRATGDLVHPLLLPGVPERFHLLDRPTVASALLVATILGAAVGALCYLLVFRWLRLAPPLARIVASLGLMTYLIGIMDLRFQSGAVAFQIEGPLPTDVVEFLGIRSPVDRYLLAGFVVVAALVVSALSRFTTFGLATRATAENETGAVLLGISADRVGILNWVLAAVLAGTTMILAAPVTRLDPATTSLLIVPALGAALLGRFDEIWVTVAAGLGIGMVQSELLNVQTEWDWLPDVGLQQGAPFLLVLIALVLRGDRTPGRGDLTPRVRLPAAPEPRHTITVTAVVLGAAAVALFGLDGQWRLGIILTAIAAVLTLSVIVLTGFVGQVSLATFALAGTAAFATVRASDDLGLGFPWAPLVGVAVATAIGTLAGLPAIRVRGMTLAIASLAAAVAIEELVFKWDWFTGGIAGSRVTPAQLFGIDLDINAPGDAFPREAFGLFVLAVLFLAMVLVVNLRRSATGRQWLAVRANERAAEAVGISAPRAKLSANGVASLLAGVGGVLTAYQSTIVSSSSFGALDSLVVVAIGYLAGIAAPAAALAAGVLTEGGLLTVAMDQVSDDASRYQFAVNGLVLIVAAIRFPAGLVGTIGRRSRPAPAVTP